MRDLHRLISLPMVALIGIGGIAAAAPPASAADPPSASAAARAPAVTGSAIATLATANIGKAACSLNSLGTKAFGSSCTGNSGKPEYWCADFAKWVWASAGVADTSWLNSLAGSFYTYGLEYHTLSAVPAVGDAAVFDYDGYGDADHVAIVTKVNPNGTIETVSGDWNGEPGTEAQFASTSSVVLNEPAYLGVLGTAPDVMGMTISAFVAPVGVRVAPILGVSKLSAGEWLSSGEKLTSPNGLYTLEMFGNGDLVESLGTRQLWSSGTAGNPGAMAVVQPGGNFVVYGPSGVPLWWSDTGGHSGQVSLVLQDDGNLMVHGSTGQLWNNLPQTDVLSAGQALLPGQQLVSENGLYNLVMQADGNLVEYTAGRYLWSTATTGNPGARVVMQPGGNLVLYSSSHVPVWWSATNGHAGTVDLVLQDDANLVVYGPSRWLWANFA